MDAGAARFRILREVGRGGMGAVFLAEDESTHARVALKRMLAPDLDRGRFLREAALLERMNHPSFVRYVAHGEDDEGAWLAMEWLEGSDLSDVLQRDLPAFGVGLELSAQILEALVVAHESQVIHRDIKPANVFVLAGPAPRVKLLDLGIARPLDASMVLTATGAIIGTPLYMAPEVLRGQPASVASDTYAAATVVFEILSGRPPFVAETSFAVIGRILLDEAPSLSQFAPDAPQSVVDALKQALHKDPAGRPPANALAESLRAAVSAWAAGDTVGMGASLAIGANLLRENRSAAVLVVRGAARVGDVWQHLVSEGSGCDVLPDGTLLALLTIPGAPDASLFRAVRLALDVYARDPGAAIVASTSRSEGLTTSVGGKAFARAGEVRATGPGVHLDRESAQMLGDRYALHDHGEYVTVRAEEPVEEERRLLGRVTPTVGREAEIAQLLSVVRAVAEEGAPRIAIVVGPAGHGKSRLRKHVLTELARPPQSVASIVARFEPGSEGTSWAGVARGIRAAAGIVADDDPAAQRARLGSFAVSLGLDAARTSFLANLAGVAAEVDRALLDLARASTQALQEGVHEALIAVLRGLAGQGASLLVLEDAHWADAASLALVDALAGVQDLPVAVVLFARPELLERPLDLVRRGPLRIDLGTLAPRAARRLALAVVPEGTREEDVARIVEMGAGNPLVLEELLRVFVEGGTLSPSASARAVFEARIARLDTRDRLVARMAAVIGEVFWEPLLQTVLRGTGTDVGGSLDALVRDELLTVRPTSRFRGARELMFRHALLRDAAYEMVPEEPRKQVSATAAQWLVERGDPDLAAVAGHAERGGLETLAGELWERAGRAALLAGTPIAAATMLERALHLLPRGHASRASLHLALEDTYRELAKRQRRARHLVAYRRLARDGTDRMRVIADVREARWLADGHHRQEGDLAARRGLERALASGALDLTAEAMIVWFVVRDHDQPPERLGELDELIRAANALPPEVRVELLYVRGIVFRRRGEVALAIATYRTAIGIFEAVGLRSSRAAAIWNALGYALIVDGRLSEARQAVMTASAILTAGGIRQVQPRVAQNLATIALVAGDVPRAIALAEEGIAHHRRDDDLLGFGEGLLIRGRLALQTGELELAEALLSEVRGLVERTQSLYDRAHLAVVYGWLCVKRERPGEALAAFLDGESLARTMCRSMSIVAGAEAARVLKRIGRAQDAHEKARHTLEQLETIDASEWGAETFDALIEAAEGSSLEGDVTLRARAYVDGVCGRIGDSELLASFERRPDVRRIREAGRTVS